MAEAITAVEATSDPQRFTLDAIDERCVGPADRRFLMGGVSLGAAITASNG